MTLESHPTVRCLESAKAAASGPSLPQIDAAALRQLALDCGAGDVGLVEIARPALAPQRDEILRHYPWTKTLVSFVTRMAREPVRGAPRSVANLEFHRAGHEVTTLDLYAIGFTPAMTAAEHRAYHGDHPLIDPMTAAHAELERRFLAFTRRHALPQPSRQMPIWWDSGLIGLADFAFVEARVIVEVDGRLGHTQLRDTELDKWRDQAAVAAGWRVMRVTWRQLHGHPERVLANLRAALEVSAA